MSALIGRNVKHLQRFNKRLLLAPLHRTFWNDPKQTCLRRRALSSYSHSTSFALRKQNFCSSPPPAATKKTSKQPPLTRVVNGTKTALITLIRVFTHPLQSWAGFKEGWHHFVVTMKHYWKGTKLLWSDVKACGSILFRLIKGNGLTWREQRQLQRTSLDILRFIPMFFFIAVPFLEFFLPVALYLFPNMLPSTFATQHQKQEKRKKILQARLKSAEFLSNIHSKYLERLEDDAELTVAKNILKKFQRGGQISSKELEKILPHFRDHITLDSLTQTQLQSLCHFLHLNPFGFSNAALRERLRKRLKYIRKEDGGIVKSGGVDKLTFSELKALVEERGMRIDKTEEELRIDLAGWIDLTQKQQIPTSLLLLSRTLMINVTAGDTAEQLSQTLKVIPDAVDEVLVESVQADDHDLEKKVIDRQSQLIKEELQAQKELTSQDDIHSLADVSIKKKEQKDAARKRVATILKTSTDDSAVEVEKQQLHDLKEQHKKQQAKIAKTESHLKHWSVLLNMELQNSTELEKEQVKCIWEKEQLDSVRFQTVFATWDVNQDLALTAKRTKQLIDEEKLREGEILKSSVAPEPKLSECIIEEEDTEEKIRDQESKDAATKKSAEKVSKKLQKMFSKLEKDIETSEKKLGDTLHLAKEEDGVDRTKLRQIVEQNVENEVAPELLDEIMHEYADDHKSIKVKIEETFQKIQHENEDEENEELDVSDVETETELEDLEEIKKSSTYTSSRNK